MIRPFHYLAAVATAAIALLTLTSATPAGWNLVWEETFDNPTGLDPTRWSKIPRGGTDWNNYMSDFDSCYALRDGNLVLRGINNRSCPNDTAPYLTGGVWTKDKVGFNNGRLEIRARLKGAQGAWPAIWILPQINDYPKGGEIDIMERLNHDKIAYQTLHSVYTLVHHQSYPKNGGTAAIDPDGYNVYGVEMYPDSIVLFINDTKSLVYPRINTPIEGQFPFNEQPFVLLLDMQLGGEWVGRVNPAELPAEMEIDWVRFYQTDNQLATRPFRANINESREIVKHGVAARPVMDKAPDASKMTDVSKADKVTSVPLGKLDQVLSTSKKKQDIVRQKIVSKKKKAAKRRQR